MKEQPSYKIAKIENLEEIMSVISDVNEEAQKESKDKITKRILENQLLCCVLNNKIVGFLGWNSTFKNNPKYWYLEQITIQKDFRGKGIGKNFIKHFLQICRDKNIKKLYAHVQKHNTPSLKMFLSSGFKINTEVDKAISNEITFEFSFE